MPRGIPTFIFILLIALGLSVWGWSLASRPIDPPAKSDLLQTTRQVPSNGWGPIRVMAANIRIAEPTDGENSWNNRRDSVVKVFLTYMPDVISCQEVSPAQGSYLNKNLSNWYAYYPRAGVGAVSTSGKGVSQGAGAEILGVLNQSLASLNTLYYRSDRFDILDGEAGLILPDQLQANATENTYCSLAVLQEKGSAKGSGVYIVIDAHFRHDSAFAVRCAVRLLEKAVDWRKKYPGASVILLGDMNFNQTSPLYATLSAPSKDFSASSTPPTGLKLTDAFDYAQKPPGAPWGTYHNFTGKTTQEWPTDLIFFSQELEPASGEHGHTQILRNQGTGQDEGRWPSDHFFVMAEFERRVK